MYTSVSLIQVAVSLIHGPIFDSLLESLVGRGSPTPTPTASACRGPTPWGRLLACPEPAWARQAGGSAVVSDRPGPPNGPFLIQLFEVLVSSTPGRGIAASPFRERT